MTVEAAYSAASSACLLLAWRFSSPVDGGSVFFRTEYEYLLDYTQRRVTSHNLVVFTVTILRTPRLVI
jgi:hypothetical protein